MGSSSLSLSTYPSSFLFPDVLASVAKISSAPSSSSSKTAIGSSSSSLYEVEVFLRPKDRLLVSAFGAALVLIGVAFVDADLEVLGLALLLVAK
jgi:hypothetical protein